MENKGIVLAFFAVLIGYCEPLGAQERFEVRQEKPSHRQALLLSALFPGLGQLATEQRYKGTALLAGQAAFLVVGLTSHADYNTQKDQFRLEGRRYETLRQGGTFAEADESWKKMRSLQDDLDASHTRRQIFGGLAVLLYGYNMIDMFLWDGAAEETMSLVPSKVDGHPALRLVARF
jgi:hypothetical protein